MIDFDIPGLPVEWLVIVQDELVRFGPKWDELAPHAKVVQGGDGASADFELIVRVGEDEDTGARFPDGGDRAPLAFRL